MRKENAPHRNGQEAHEMRPDNPFLALLTVQVNAQVNTTHAHGADADNSSHAQRIRLLEALRKRSLTTLEARRELDVLHPAARIQELRGMGYDIQTVRVPDLTTEGKPHNVARYILRGQC